MNRMDLQIFLIFAGLFHENTELIISYSIATAQLPLQRHVSRFYIEMKHLIEYNLTSLTLLKMIFWCTVFTDFGRMTEEDAGSIVIDDA